MILDSGFWILLVKTPVRAESWRALQDGTEQSKIQNHNLFSFKIVKEVCGEYSSHCASSKA